MDDSVIVTLAPELQARVRRIRDAEKNKCLMAYLDMVTTMSRLSEDFLIQGAFDYARSLTDSEEEDILGNAWLQALALKNMDLAVSVREVILAGGMEC